MNLRRQRIVVLQFGRLRQHARELSGPPELNRSQVAFRFLVRCEMSGPPERSERTD
jgi:hypothetical protein